MRLKRPKKLVLGAALVLFAFCHLFFATYAVACAFHHAGPHAAHHAPGAGHHGMLCSMAQCGGAAVVAESQSTPADLPTTWVLGTLTADTQFPVIARSSITSRAPPPFPS